MEEVVRCRVLSSQYRLRGLSHLQATGFLHDCFLRTSSRLKPPFVQRPESAYERALAPWRSLRGAPSLNPSLAPADVADHPLHRPASP